MKLMKGEHMQWSLVPKWEHKVDRRRCEPVRNDVTEDLRDRVRDWRQYGYGVFTPYGPSNYSIIPVNPS